VACAERAVSEQSDYFPSQRILASAYAMSGRMDEARRTMAEIVRARPQLRLSNLKDWMGPFRRQDIERYAEAYRLAGMPE
jgi:hypothetical protein